MRHVGSWPGQPIHIFQIPANRPLERIRQLLARRPTQLSPDLGCIDGVTEVMSRPVSDERDLIGIGTVVAPWRMPIELGADLANEVDVATLTSCANVVPLPRSSSLPYSQQRAGMILHVDPIADVVAAAVNRNWSVPERCADHRRYELFRKSIRPVIIRTAGHDYGQSVGPVLGAGEVIGRSLAGGVW